MNIINFKKGNIKIINHFQMIDDFYYTKKL